jgi:hypothetical protein
MAVTLDGSAGVTTNAGGSVNPSTNIDGINYSCRAWVNFNGNGPVIRGSGNVSSITVNATGNYTVTFTNALSNANYAYTIIGSNITNWGGINTINTDQAANSVPPTTTACRFQLLRYDTSASANPLYVNVIVVN